MTTPNKTISTESLSHESRTFAPSPEVLKRALLNAPEFNALYERSVREPDKFWLEQADTLEWFKKPTVAGKFIWDSAAKKIEHTFFEDGQLNLTVNCLDRPVKTKLRDKIAISNGSSVKICIASLLELRMPQYKSRGMTSAAPLSLDLRMIDSRSSLSLRAA